jgi:hypothetical protein
MAVPVINIVIEQGTDFSRTYSLKTPSGSPLNLTNYTFDAKMRKWSGSSGNISFATTYNSDPTQGKVTLSLANAQTGIITEGRYNYDLIIENLNSNIKTKVVTGQATVNATIS